MTGAFLYQLVQNYMPHMLVKQQHEKPDQVPTICLAIDKTNNKSKLIKSMIGSV